MQTGSRGSDSARVERAVIDGALDGRMHRPLVRLFTDGTFIVRAVRYALGLPTPMRTEDRRVLEQVIFRHYLAREDMQRILFVGCQWYTRHYEQEFFAGREYWTIEPSARARRFGARRHIVAPLERLAQYFAQDALDLILCNAVYGYGLDSSTQCEAAFEQCYTRLRPGGQLVLGWNDVPARTPIPLSSIASLRAFSKVVLPELGTWRYRTDTVHRHTYDFYGKQPRASASAP